MNTVPPESPRFVCRVVRWWAAFNESSASPTLSGHRANCPACRAHFQSQAALEARLRHEARNPNSVVPCGLEHRIAEALRRTQLPDRTPPRRSFPIWAAGFTTAVATVAVVVLPNWGPGHTPTMAEVAPADIAAVYSAVSALPQQLDRVFAAPETRVAADDPLDRELDNVKADARSALNFLAENFLPVERRDPTSSAYGAPATVLGS